MSRDYTHEYANGYRRRVRHEIRFGLVMTYAAAGFLTFAHVYENSTLSQYDAAEKNFGSAIAGLAWPVYWSGRSALWVVRGKKPKLAQGTMLAPQVMDPPGVVIDLRTIPYDAVRCLDAWGRLWKPIDNVCDAAGRDARKLQQDGALVSPPLHSR